MTLSDEDKREIERILALREYAKRDLMTFFKEFAWPAIEPNTPLSINWAMELMCEYLMALVNRELTEYNHSLLINIAPRHTKSSIACIALPMWRWLNVPEERFLHTSFNLDLATKHSEDRRAIIKSKSYQLLRPIKLKGGDSKKFFQNTDQGYSKVVPRSRATGSGATGLIMDDLHATTDSPDEVENGVNDYKNGLKNRLNQKDSFKLMVQHRVGERDTSQVAIDEGYYHLNIPAMCNERKSYFFLKSGRVEVVEPNVLIDPTRLTDNLETLMKNDVVWATQYLQTPQVKGGAIFKEESFQHLPDLFYAPYERRILSLDTAATDEEYSAKWAFELFQFTNPDGVVYLSHVHSDKYEYYEGKAKLIDLIQTLRPTEILIEKKSTGISLLSDLPNELGHLCPKLIEIRPKGDKKIRATIASDAILSRTLVVNREAEWYSDFINEIKLFPLSRYKDKVDALSQFFIWLKEESYKDYYQKGLTFDFD